MSILDNIGGTDDLFTHPSNVLAFSKDYDDTTLVYLVGRESPIKVCAPVTDVVDLYEEQILQADEYHSHDSHIEDGFTPVDELTEEEVLTLQEALQNIKDGAANE